MNTRLHIDGERRSKGRTITRSNNNQTDAGCKRGRVVFWGRQDQTHHHRSFQMLQQNKGRCQCIRQSDYSSGVWHGDRTRITEHHRVSRPICRKTCDSRVLVQNLTWRRMQSRGHVQGRRRDCFQGVGKKWCNFVLLTVFFGP